MRIGIYSKWLNTLGGGEKLSSVMAEAFSKRGHEVELISTFDVEKTTIEKWMGVDLSKVKLISWFERSYARLSSKTKKYDVFINTSYLDHLPSKAKKSVYYVHFPTPVKQTFLGFIKYEKLLPFLRKYLVIPEISKGIKPLDEVYVRSGKWLGKQNTVVLSNAPKTFKMKLRIYSELVTVEALDRVLINSPNTKLELIDRFIDQRNNILTYIIRGELGGESSAVIKITLKGDTSKEARALVSLTMGNLRYLLWNIIKRFLPRYEMALYGSSSYKPAVGLSSYDHFLANSNFTKTWTKRYWNKKSKVLYPPVDVDQFKPGKKRNVILNVGRFFVGGHSKKQDFLVKTFKSMVDKSQLTNWELHLVGSVSGAWDHAEYVRSIKAEAKGYPVYFHHASDFKDLKKLYSTAKIYWHATGVGENEHTSPIAFEHFGITVVEAMAAGAVPVVYEGGGLVEIVDSSVGFTWKSSSQLASHTLKIARDKRLYERLSISAREKSHKYSRKRFIDEAAKIIESV